MFLLEAVKEMMNINKTVENKNDELKEMNKTKEKQIQDDKNEIKELKKDIMKLNKIIKTNLLVNRKLNQKVDSLKIQLEKEKNKNKSNTKKEVLQLKIRIIRKIDWDKEIKLMNLLFLVLIIKI